MTLTCRDQIQNYGKAQVDWCRADKLLKRHRRKTSERDMMWQRQTERPHTHLRTKCQQLELQLSALLYARPHDKSVKQSLSDQHIITCTMSYEIPSILRSDCNSMKSHWTQQWNLWTLKNSKVAQGMMCRRLNCIVLQLVGLSLLTSVLKG